MKALTIKQPWAGLVFCDTIIGPKEIENRSRKTNYRGELYIHAGKNYDTEGEKFLLKNMNIKPDDFEITKIFGCIIGVVKLTGVLDMKYEGISPWFFGPFGWVLDNPKIVDPVSLRGQLGIFSWGHNERYP